LQFYGINKYSPYYRLIGQDGLIT